MDRTQIINHDCNNSDLIFQIISWKTCDVVFCDEEEDDDEKSQNEVEKYVIKVFGVTKEGHSVSVNFLNYTPYFFIKLPFAANDFTCIQFREFLKSKLSYKQRESLLKVDLFKKQDFYGFHNGKKFNFIRFTFSSVKTFRFAIKIFQKVVNVSGFNAQKFKLYESNIDPFLRMIHIRDIEPTGWVQIPKGMYEMNEDIMPTRCQIDVSCPWNAVIRYNHEAISPLIVASFDLECSSSHGDFPVAIKDYRKVAQEIMQNIDKDCNSEYLTSEILAIYNPSVDGKLSKVFTKEGNSKIDFEMIKKRIKRSLDDIQSILHGKLVFVEDKLTSPSKTDKITKDDTMRSLIQKLNTIGLPELEGDKIIQIGTTFHRYGDKKCNFKSIITLGSCDLIDGVQVDACDTESDMILKWCKLINAMDPDVVTGYNILGFDFTYLYQRAQELGIQRELCNIGKIQDEVCPFVEKMLSSSALGDNLLKYIDMEGRVIIDIMKVVQRDHKLDSYKLDAVASHFMKQNKNDLLPNDIFRMFKGTSQDRKVIAEYCVQDCELCNLLIIKLETLANNIGMSNVCYVPLSYIFLRGQSIKIFSLVAKQCREDNFLIPSLSKPWGEVDDEEAADDDGYEGAIVLPPKTGIYIEDPVSVLDYASLYPSSMISENLSQDTIVLEEKYNNIPGVEYLDIPYDLYEGVGDKKKKCGEKICRFVQTKEKGVLPRILMKLLRQRKETRKKIEFKTVSFIDGSTTPINGIVKESKDGSAISIIGADGNKIGEYSVDVLENMKDTYNEFQKAVLDGLQSAYKVTANSLYGQTGSKMSSIYMKEIAACTTATGRKMIMLAKNFLEENYCAEIIYGDSVPRYTPILIRVAGESIRLETIDKLGIKYGNGKWTKCYASSDKEYCDLSSGPLIESWTDNGWTQIYRVIRHILAPHKKIVRILTLDSMVDVTDDHSLLRSNGEEASPKDLYIGDDLLHVPLSFYPELDKILHQNITFTSKEARILGFYCGMPLASSSMEFSTLHFIDNNIFLRKKYLEICKTVFPQFQWELVGNDKIVPKSYDDPISVMEFSMQNRDILCYGLSFDKIVPTTILNSSFKIRKSFWKGMRDSNTKIFMEHSYISRASVSLLCESLKCCNPLYDMTPQSNTIIDMFEIPYQGYVYDLTTANHHFQAGIGSLIVHNTDSLFVCFDIRDEHGNKLKGKDALAGCRSLGIKASHEIKKIIKPPHDLEWEKLFWPMILFSKKRYVANKYEHDDDHFKQSSMGIVMKRRDNANIVKKIYGGILDIILNEKDIKKSIVFLQASLNKFVDGQYPLEDLIITKSLKSHYLDPEKIAHKVLADRVKAREPGNAFQVNDRIPYIYVKTPALQGKNVLQGERIETVDFIKKNKLKPDYEFYLTNQIMKSILQLYALVLEDLDGYRKGSDYYKEQYKKILKEKEGNEKKAKDRWQDLREADVKAILFDPILIKLSNEKQGLRSITDFFKPS
jgi:DNA polymerase elongation subunit (family B)